MKTLQITMPPQLVRRVDQVAKSAKMSRSGFIRDALERELKRRRRLELEEIERKAYERMPVQPGEFAIVSGSSIEGWDDDWEVWERIWKESNAAKSAGAPSTSRTKRGRSSSSRKRR